MEGQTTISSSSIQHYDHKSNLSRRSVDWRDSGIVIDEDHRPFNSFDAASCEFTSDQPTATPTTAPASTNINSCCPLQQVIGYDHDDDGDTILHLAVVGFALNKVKDLIKICDLNAINNMMQTPLHVAVLANRPEMVDLLLRSGAKLNIPDRRGNTPVHLACQKGLVEILIIMLESLTQADKLPREGLLVLEQHIESTNFDGQTCLHLAATNDQRNIIELLVNKYNANLDCLDSRSGETIMHKAIKKFNLGLVAFILSLDKHCNRADYSGRRPLDYIRKLQESRLDQVQSEKMHVIERLVTDRIRLCIEQNGCCLASASNNGDEEILETSSSSSDYSDSDYDLN